MNIFKIKYILLGIAFTFCLDGCTSEPTSIGSDNSVISFSLKKGKNTYTASIGENTIDIQISESENLKGAVPNYLVSERAVIEPSFLSIKDWEQTIEFTVSSFNGRKKQYTYKCTKIKDIHHGTFVLSTQAEIDAFAKLKAEYIDGDLIIGQNIALDAADSISDLSALNSLQAVSRNIVFKSSIKLDSINCFANLQRAGGLYFGTKDKIITFNDSLTINMPLLQNAGELIFNGNFIKHISMPKLETAQKLFIQSKGIKTVQFDELKELIGEFVIQGGSENSSDQANLLLTSINFPKLQSTLGELKLHNLSNVEVISFAELKDVEGDLTLTRLPALTECQIDNIEQVMGAIKIEDINNLPEFDVPKLHTIGAFSFEGSYMKPEIEFNFSLLKKIENNFLIKNTKTNKIDFPNLEYVGNGIEFGSIVIDLKDFKLPKLKYCKNIKIWLLENLETVDCSLIESELSFAFNTCPKLVKITASKVKDIILNASSKITEIPQFEGFTEISGKLEFKEYSKTTNISIPNLKKIGSLVNTSGASNTILGLPDLEEIDNIDVGGRFIKELLLPKLKQVNNNLKIAFGNMTEDGIDVSKLEKVGGEFYIQGGRAAWDAKDRPLQNLSSFETLKEVGSVKIEWFGKLTDFTGLKNIIPSLSVDKWKVVGCKYNPTYEDMINGKYTPHD